MVNGPIFDEDDPNQRRRRQVNNQVRRSRGGGVQRTAPIPFPGANRPQPLTAADPGSNLITPLQPGAGSFANRAPRRSGNIERAARGGDRGLPVPAANPNTNLILPLQPGAGGFADPGQPPAELPPLVGRPVEDVGGFQPPPNQDIPGTRPARELAGRILNQPAGVTTGQALRGTGEFLLQRARNLVSGAGGIRRGLQGFTSNVFEGAGLPTDLLEGTALDPLRPPGAGGAQAAEDQAAPARPGAVDEEAGTQLTEEQRRALRLTRLGDQREPATLTNEIPGESGVLDKVRQLEERGIDVERIGADPTTVIRGTQVSQTAPGAAGDDDIAGLEEFGEGFEVPIGTTAADLRDPLRRQQLMARNSLDQALRQVPAPGEAGISAEAQAKALADFDAQAAAERGETTRSREELASLERRTAANNAVARAVGLRRNSALKTTVVDLGESGSGRDRGQAIVITNPDGTSRILPLDRGHADRDTQQSRERVSEEIRETNPNISQQDLSEMIEFWVLFNRFPQGTNLR